MPLDKLNPSWSGLNNYSLNPVAPMIFDTAIAPSGAWRPQKTSDSVAISPVTATRSEHFNLVNCGSGALYTALPTVPANEVVVVNDSSQSLNLRRVSEPSYVWVLNAGYTESFWVSGNANELEANAVAVSGYKLKIRNY